MKNLLLTLFTLAAVLYLLSCGWLYFRQESLLFYPQKLPANYRFAFPGVWAERPITAPDGTRLSSLLFKAHVPAKGLVFFLHGNGGSLAGWGEVAPTYTRLGYDVSLLDYRGYGKSAGRIGSEAQLLADVEAAYQQATAGYDESQVVIAGYSLGTGPAAWLAARQHPRLLLLHAPYFSMTDLAARTVPVWPVLPGWLLRYPLATNAYLPRVAAPVVLFHGTHDALIPYSSSVRLRALLRLTDQLIMLPGAGHNGLLATPQYQAAIARLL